MDNESLTKNEFVSLKANEIALNLIETKSIMMIGISVLENGKFVALVNGNLTNEQLEMCIKCLEAYKKEIINKIEASEN